MRAGRTSRVVGFSVPPAVLREVESLAKAERRTKSELFREMVRVYRRYRRRRDQDEERWIDAIIREARAEEAANPMSAADLLKESRRLALLGARQARLRGIKPNHLGRLIHEHRQAQRP
jgi:metal-responsive CopG/Arc/MetJ family transcriptional regulator